MSQDCPEGASAEVSLFFFLFAVQILWSCKGLALWREKLPGGTRRDSGAEGGGGRAHECLSRGRLGSLGSF